MKNITFIYFDVGGVAILDFSKTNKFEKMLMDLGVVDSQLEEFIEFYDTFNFDYADRLEDMLTQVSKRFNLTIPSHYDMVEDFVNRFEPNMSIQPLIRFTKEKYRVGLLTNMYEGMLQKILEAGLLPDIEWDEVIDSSVVMTRKPEPKIYEIAEERAGVQPEEILFIDNSQANIDAAATRGWQVQLYDPSDTMKSNKLLVGALKSQ